MHGAIFITLFNILRNFVKKPLFIFILIFICVTQIQGMKRSLQEIHDTPIEMSTIPSELMVRIISWCNPATRNVLMKVSTYFNFFASSSNSALLAIEESAPIHLLDSLKYTLQYIKNSNNTILKYLFIHKKVEQSRDGGVNFVVVANIFCKNPACFQSIRSILLKRNASNIALCLDEVLKINPDRDPKKFSFDFTMMMGIVNKANDLPKNLMKICNDDEKVEELETYLPRWLMGAIVSNNTDAILVFLGNKQCSRLVRPGFDLFSQWPKWLKYACMHQEATMFKIILEWLCIHRVHHFLGIIIRQSAFKIININKHQYLELLMDEGKKYLAVEKFNALVLELLSYAYKYKKQDSSDLLAFKYLN